MLDLKVFNSTCGIRRSDHDGFVAVPCKGANEFAAKIGDVPCAVGRDDDAPGCHLLRR